MKPSKKNDREKRVCMNREAGFASFDIKETWVDLLRQMNIVQPTPVQSEAIPPIQQGSDLIAESQTGSGKTLAYLLPVLQKIDPGSKHLQAMIVVPTRELAVQILHEIGRFQEVSGIAGQALIGGAALNRQIDRLKQHPQIVAGTPGRILELIKMKKVKMDQVGTIVVDEVDQMLEAGSGGEVEQIFHSALRDRQILFFSATVPEAAHRLDDRWMKPPVRISSGSAGRSPEQIEHWYLVCEPRDKIDTLRRLIRALQPHSALIFVNEIGDIGELAAKLNYVGLSVEALYGDSGKQDRAAVLQRFRLGKTRLLIATDVAARGLDIEGLTHVFHFDPATDADHYLHRSGRTGRMGKKGWSVSIVTPRQQFIMGKFAGELGVRFDRKSMFHGELVDPASAEGIKRASAAAGKANPAPIRRPASKPGGNPDAVPSRPKANPDATPFRSKVNPDAASSRSKANPDTAPSRPKAKPKNRKDRKNTKDKGAPKWLKEKRER